jgi:plastocyanin
VKKLASLLVLALASAALVACGDDDGTTTTTAPETSGGAAAEGGEKAGGGEGGGGGASLSFEADPEGGLAYTTTEATAEAGKVAVDFNNPQPVAHDVAIEDSSGAEIAKTDVITEGEDSTTANLKAGEYAFYCTVPGHREAGMEGTLTVE